MRVTKRDMRLLNTAVEQNPSNYRLRDLRARYKEAGALSYSAWDEVMRSIHTSLPSPIDDIPLAVREWLLSVGLVPEEIQEMARHKLDEAREDVATSAAPTPSRFGSITPISPPPVSAKSVDSLRKLRRGPG